MKNPMITLVRTVHGLITAYFLACMLWIYYSAITNHPNTWASLAVASLFVEGLVVFLNHGDCPLGTVHHRLGDQKAFFELFLPKPVAKRAVPFLGLVSVIGAVLLFV